MARYPKVISELKNVFTKHLKVSELEVNVTKTGNNYNVEIRDAYEGDSVIFIVGKELLEKKSYIVIFEQNYLGLEHLQYACYEALKEFKQNNPTTILYDNERNQRKIFEKIMREKGKILDARMYN